MKKLIEKIIEKLEEIQIENTCSDCPHKEKCDEVQENISDETTDLCGATIKALAIEIVKQEAEKFVPDTNVGNNGWIPCSVRLPDEAFGCLVTVMDCEPSTQTDFENILPYFVGYDGETWNDADGEEIPFEVIAWRKLPTPYKQKGE